MISKNEVMVTVTAQDEQSFSAFACLIDERLKAYDGVHPVSISVPKGCSERVIKRIIAAYTDASMAWKVKRNSGDDQRDGCWDNLVFS